MKKSALLFLILVLSLPALPAQSVAGLLKGTTQQKQGTAQSDPLGRDTPSGTVLGFLQAAQSGDYRAAADYLQMSPSHRQSQGVAIAQKLKVLMDRAYVGSLRHLSTNIEGNPDNDRPDLEVIGTFSVGDTDVQVTLVHVTEPNSGRIWLFSADTLSKVPDLYDNVEAHQVETKLPEDLVKYAFLGMPLWQWLALIVAIPVALAIGWVIVLILAVPRLLYLKYKKQPDLRSYRRVSTPLLLFFATIAHRIIAGYFGLPLLSRLYYYRTIGVFVSIGFFWFVLRVTGVTMQKLRIRAISAGRTGTGTLMVLGERLLNALVIVVGLLAVLSIMGFNLTTVLAGVGIGGIAIAFAAQKTLENLFGGISVLADEVIRVGDYCRFGDRTGTVEDISLRSTRVRTDARTQLSIPNGSLATISIENFTRRDKIQFNPPLAIRCQTTPDQLRYLLAEIRRLLYQHPKVETNTAFIRFANVDSSALRLEISSYILTRDSNEFNAIREDLLLRIMEIVDRSGTAFAFPSQTLFLGRDPGLDEKKTAAAEEQVQQWRDQHQLPFPDFAPEEKSSLRGSIPYPPPESAVANKQL